MTTLVTVEGRWGGGGCCGLSTHELIETQDRLKGTLKMKGDGGVGVNKKNKKMFHISSLSAFDTVMDKL